jgi:hypothetical protein
MVLEKLSSKTSIPALALVACLLSSCLGGGSGGETPLVVTPGDRISVELGQDLFGVSGDFVSLETLDHYRGAEIPGRTNLSSSTAEFRYARTATPSFTNILTLKIRPALFSDDIELKTFAAITPLTADFSTDRTVNFFHKILKRDPSSVDEIAFVLQRFRSTTRNSCMNGRSLPTLSAALRVMDVSLAGSVAYNEIVEEFDLTVPQRSSLAGFNSGPRIIAGVPFPSPVGETAFTIQENTQFNLNMTVLDSEQDLYFSEWRVDGRPLSEFPFLLEKKGNLPDTPAEFQSPLGLRITTDYAMASGSSSKDYALELSLCDGGPLVKYNYKVSVNDTNRDPVITVMPSDTETLSTGVEKILTIVAEDYDGDTMSFALSPAVRENVLLSPEGDFASSKIPRGLFVFNAKTRNTLGGTFAQSNPWLEGASGRGAATAIPQPLSMEFYSPAGPNFQSSRVKIKGLDPSNPTDIQDVPAAFSFATDPSNNMPSTLQFIVGDTATNQGLKLFQPLAIEKAQMYCIMSESGSRGGYSMQVACNMDRYPQNFTRDGEWLFSMRCAGPTEGTSTSPNNRCDQIAGTPLAATPGSPNSRVEMKVAIRLERYQEAVNTFLESLVVVDARGGSAGGVLKMLLPIQPLTVTSPWSKLSLFEHFQWPAGETAPDSGFTLVDSPNYVVSHNLKNPFTRWNLDGGSRDIFAEPPGSLVKRGTRGQAMLEKTRWWQHVRWEQREDSSSASTPFEDSPFLMFLTASPDNPEPRLLLSTGLGEYSRLRHATSLFATSVGSLSGAKVMKYEVLSSSDTVFEFKVLNGIEYKKDLYCEARLNFDRGSAMPLAPNGSTALPIDSDWQLRCDETLALARASSDYYRYSYGPQSLYTETAHFSPGSGYSFSPSVPTWRMVRCAVGENSTTDAGKPCAQSSVAAAKTVNLYFLGKAVLFPKAWGGPVAPATTPLDWDAYDPEEGLLNDYTIASHPIKVGIRNSTVDLYPNSRRMILNDTALPGYRWCRYALRNRMTVLVMTCSKTAPTLNLASNYPALYEYDATGDRITLEFSYGVQLAATTGPLPQLKTEIGMPVVAHEKLVSAPTTQNKQVLVEDTFQIPSLKQALTAFKLSYDNSLWQNPRIENLLPRPRLKSASITLITTGAGGGETPVTNNPLSIWTSNTNLSGDPVGWSVQSPQFHISAVGVNYLEPNEFLVAWRPVNPGNYRLNFVLEQTLVDGSKQTKDFSVIVFVKEFVYPPQLNIVDTDLTYPSAGDPPGSAGRIDVDTGISVNLLPKVTPGRPTMYLSIASKMATYTKVHTHNKMVASNFSVIANLPTVSAFWLTETVDGKRRLVDPLAEPADGEDPWYERWPLPFDATTSIASDQVVVSRRDPTYQPGIDDEIVPSVVLDGLNRDYVLKSTNSSLSFAATDTLSLYVVPKVPAIKDEVKLRIKGETFNATILKPAAYFVDGDTATDIQVADMDAATFASSVGNTATCRIFYKYPTALIKGQDLSTEMRLFCVNGTQATFDPVAVNATNTMPDIKTAISASEPDPATLIYALSAVTTASFDSTKHTLRSPSSTNFAAVPNSTSFAGIVGSLSWGDPATKMLKNTEKNSSFRAVLVITDGSNIIYQPIKIESVGGEETATDLLGSAAGALPACNGTTPYNIVQRAPPQSTDPKIECVLPKRTHSEGLQLYTIGTTPSGSGPAFSLENPTDLVSSNKSMIIDPAADKWDSYPSDLAYKPSLKLETIGAEERWVFRWEIPTVARNKIQNRSVTFGFSTGFDFQRHLFNSGISGLFGASGTRLGTNFRTTQNISGGRDLLWHNLTDQTLPALPAEAPFQITVNVEEPNVPPCLVAQPDLSGLQVGAPCPDRDTLAANIDKDESGDPAVRLVSPTAATPGNVIDTEINYHMVPSSAGGFVPLFEGDTAEIRFYAFDQNLSAGPIQSLGNWESLLGPFANFTISRITDDPLLSGKPWLVGGRLVYTPTDSDILKVAAAGDFVTIKTKISDDSLGGNASADASQTFNIKVWDKNQPPTVALPLVGTVKHYGNSATRNFVFSVSDSDKYDSVRVTYLGANTDVTSPTSIGDVMPTTLQANGSYTVDFSYVDDPALAEVPEVSFFFKVEDVPWWTSNGRGIGDEYYQNHPKYVSSTGLNPFLDPSPAQVHTVTSSLVGNSTVLGSPRPRRVYLNQTWLEPIVVSNPLKLPVSCSIAKQPVLQVLNPNYSGPPPEEGPLPPGYDGNEFINSTNVPVLRTVSKSENTLPENTPCVIEWTPTDAGWVTSGSADRQMRVQIQVGAQTLSDSWTFNVADFLQPANNPRPSLLSAPGLSLRAEDGVSAVQLTPSHVDSDVPVYLIKDGESVKFLIEGLEVGYTEYGFTWYRNGTAVASNKSDWKFSPTLTDSGLHEISVFVRDASILPASYLPLDSESGYQLFRAKVFVRNTKPLAPGTLTSGTDYIRFDSKSNPSLMGVQSLFEMENGYFAGVLSRVILDPQLDQPSSIPYVAKIGTSRSPGSMSALGSSLGVETAWSALSNESSTAADAEVFLGNGPLASLPDNWRSLFRFSSALFDPGLTGGVNTSTLMRSHRFQSSRMSSVSLNSTTLAQIDHAAGGTELQLRDSDDGSVQTHTWNSMSFATYSTLVATGKGSLIFRGKETAQASNKFYLAKDLSTDEDPVVLNLGLTPTNGGAVWVAPCLASSCGSNDVEIAALAFDPTQPARNFVAGVLNTSTGAFVPSSASSAGINLPISSSGFVGAASIQDTAALNPSFQSADAPANNTFMIINRGQSTFLTVDLESGSFETSGVAGGQLSTLNCRNDIEFCHLGDTGNEGVMVLK